MEKTSGYIDNYDIDEFIDQCNLSPYFKKYRKVHGSITKNILRENNFIRKKYQRYDLVELGHILYEMQNPIEPRSLKKIKLSPSYVKLLSHLKKIQTIDAQRLIMDCRDELEMPFRERGFIIESQPVPELVENFTNTNFYFSTEFRDWFFKSTNDVNDYDQWQKASFRAHHLIDLIVKKVLTKWGLPQRYYKAIRELILFNRIIPATTGEAWQLERSHDNNNWQYSITFTPDSTKRDLRAMIDQDQYGIFKNNKRHQPSLARRPERKSEQKKLIIQRYNDLKLMGMYKNVQLFIILGSEFMLSPSTIRKHIKGK